MSFDSKVISETEQKIINYYHDIDEIRWLKTKLNNLEHRKSQVEDDIKNSNIVLSTDENLAIDYSKESVGCQSICKSPIEKKIESAFKKLEQEKDRICSEIIEIKIRMRELEENVEKIEFILNLLSDENKRFIRMRYKENRNYIFISNELHISKSTINRTKENILYSISKYICNLF